MIAGELDQNPEVLSPGAGPVRIENNLIQSNMSNDDGGGIRLLQPVDGPVSITNNIIVNNVATDAGGGISIDDALDVRIVNNTISYNISTATAEDADRSTCSPVLLGSCPHSAGVASEVHSRAIMEGRFPATTYSDPVMFNNIITSNSAYYLDGAGNLPLAGFIDLEVIGTPASEKLRTSYSLTTSADWVGVGNVSGEPYYQQTALLTFEALAFAGDPAFVTVQILSTQGDPSRDYHIGPFSFAANRGEASLDGVAAPPNDFENEGRPQFTVFDIGADERTGESYALVSRIVLPIIWR
jgi:hypothetical protein